MTRSEYRLFILLGGRWMGCGFCADPGRALEEQQHFEYVLGIPAKIIGHYFAGPATRRVK